MEEINSAAMLAAKRSVGVTPEMNLREHVTCMPSPMLIRLPTLALKPRGDVTRSPKQGYQWPHKKDFCPPKTLEKKSHIKAWIGGPVTHVAGRVFLDAALDNVHLTLAALTGRVVAR